MPTSSKDPVLVIVQLSGGNDYLNTVIPYTDGLYYDQRPHIGIPQDKVMPVGNSLGLHPSLKSIKEKFWDTGKMAIIHGVGYPNPNRSHFRSMDIWHTCEPDKMSTDGWLGKAVRDMDPKGENVLTAVSFGPGLPRALALPGVPVASVMELERAGVLTGINPAEERKRALETFSRIYGPTVGTGYVLDYLRQVGNDILKGSDILKTAPQKYSSTVEYAATPIAQSLKSVAQVHLAELGTRVLYVEYGNFDTHANELATHAPLWEALGPALGDFYDDLKEHNASENVLMLLFTEFGRRVNDNGTGTDHGSGGGAFLIGDKVKGGMYGEYPSLKAEKLLDGDLHFNYDFRGLYSTILERWMKLEARPLVGGSYEQMGFLKD
ncbi:MAG: DUF1501 domain-containing protein [SAR202 cluster bacterium]|nr:DUF1501 domain-containing protein [SAR202 cluster bacterium]